MLKSIIEYEDYRQYMQDFYEDRKRTGAFTWREFAKRAGFSSPNFIKLVCEGKSGLSPLSVERVASVMGFVGIERVYFRSLVMFSQAKKDSDKKNAYKEMCDIAGAHRVRLLEGEAYAFYESWKNTVIRELAPMMPGAKPLEMAKMCIPSITAAEVSETLSFLVKAGFLEKDGEGYRQANKSVAASAAALPMLVRSMHKQMSDFAKESMDKVSVEERNISGVTVGIDREDYEKIVGEIEELRRKVVAIATEKNSAEQVYHLNLQFFPLTRNTIGGEK